MTYSSSSNPSISNTIVSNGSSVFENIMNQIIDHKLELATKNLKICDELTLENVKKSEKCKILEHFGNIGLEPVVIENTGETVIAVDVSCLQGRNESKEKLIRDILCGIKEPGKKHLMHIKKVPDQVTEIPVTPCFRGHVSQTYDEVKQIEKKERKKKKFKAIRRVFKYFKFKTKKHKVTSVSQDKSLQTSFEKINIPSKICDLFLDSKVDLLLKTSDVKLKSDDESKVSIPILKKPIIIEDHKKISILNSDSHFPIPKNSKSLVINSSLFGSSYSAPLLNQKIFDKPKISLAPPQKGFIYKHPDSKPVSQDSSITSLIGCCPKIRGYIDKMLTEDSLATIANYFQKVNPK